MTDVLWPMARIRPSYISVTVEVSTLPFAYEEGGRATVYQALAAGSKRYAPPLPIETIEPAGGGPQPSSAAGAGRFGPAVHLPVFPSKIWVRACRWSLDTIRPSFRWAVPVSQRLPYRPDWPRVQVLATGS